MKTGLVLGKFMPLHKGHLALFDFAMQQCDKLCILLCYTNNEIICGAVRAQWLKAAAANLPAAEVVSFCYDENELPNTSVSSKEVAFLWSNAIKTILPAIDIIISSEPYGDYLAGFLQIEHIMFDRARIKIPVAASTILKDPFSNWDSIATEARSYFTRKVVLLGTESTGKSTLTEKLAAHFKVGYVPEMAREILEKTTDCRPEHLKQIAELHAQEIIQQKEHSGRLLFIDTDINITRSYSQYLFQEEMEVPELITEANKADLYLFLEPDCPYIQDGTRLSNEERNKLSLFHKAQLKQSGIVYFSITGNWNERFEKACSVVSAHFNI